MTRQNFTPAKKRAVRERSNGICEVSRLPRCMYPLLPVSCNRPAEEVDHITPAWCGGPATLENAADLCVPCHRIKTVIDNKEAKKSARRRGEKGQQARRTRAKANGTYRGIAKHKDPWPKGRKLQSRPFGKKGEVR